jgi:uncharacterized LabA/DUF88 family protein
MAKTTQPHGIAVFIDFENLVTRTGVTEEAFDLQAALDKLAGKGRVVFQRAYCDWERFPAAKASLHQKGVELINVPPSTRSGKNGADIRLVIDALELAYLREHVDTFVIMSGDSDFCPLAYKLRENNRIVIGMAVRESTSPLFARACDEFIFLRPKAAPRKGRKAAAETGGQAALVDGEPAGVAAGDEPPQPKTAETPPRPATATLPAAKRKPARAAPAARKETAVPVLAREVVAALLSKATGPVNPSVIKSAIVRRSPDFDVRSHGFSTFGRMIEALEKEGLLRRQEGQGGQWYVLPPT